MSGHLEGRPRSGSVEWQRRGNGLRTLHLHFERVVVRGIVVDVHFLQILDYEMIDDVKQPSRN